MSNWKKASTVLLAIIMVLAMSVGALAATLTDGEVGGFTTADTPVSQDKNIDLKKELTVYNVDDRTIYAPTITYNYTVTAGPADTSITDATTDHNNNTAVTVQTRAGILEGLKVAGAAGATGTIAWTSAETVNASTDGTPNYKNLNLDFSGVVFGAAGVYRYTITEALPTDATYAASGVTETTNTTNAHVRYLDVYVRPAQTFTDGSIAADWDIYGYVCVLENEAITPDGDTTETGAVKTNGFVAGENDETDYKADSYYTYNVEVSKTVHNDSYAQANHAFPFTVLFTNATVTQPVDISSETTGTVSGFTDPASAALSAGTTNGIVEIKDSSSVKYIGIPNGTSVEVYETNDVAGVTYQVTTVVDNDTQNQVVDQAVVSGTKPTSATAQAAEKAMYESTKTTLAPTADVDDDTAHTIAVDNNLQVISPTGVALRVAPYVLMLAGGVVLLVVARRKRATR